MNKHLFFISALTCIIFSLKSQGLPLDSNSKTNNENHNLDVGMAIYNSSVLSAFPQDFCDHILETAPQKIKDTILLLNDSQCLKRILPKKLLLFGPSGSGKSTLARVIAQQIGRDYIFINAGLLGNEYKNSAAQNLRRAIESVLSRPCVIIIDEADAILRQPKNENNPDIDTPKQIWEILDICEQNSDIFVICIANDIKDLPEPVQTRFAGDTVEVSLAGSHHIRKRIILFYLHDLLHNCDEEYLNWLAKKTEKFSYRELEKLVSNAMTLSYLRKSTPYLLTKHDFNIEFARMESSRSLLKEKSWINYEKCFQYGLQIAGLVVGVMGLMNSWRSATEAYDQQERNFTQLAQQFRVLTKKAVKIDPMWEFCDEKECFGKTGPVEKFLPGVTYRPIPSY